MFPCLSLITDCSPAEALESATLHPAQAMGITNKKGTLDFGTDADFLLLNDDLDVLATFTGGDLVWQSDESPLLEDPR